MPGNVIGNTNSSVSEPGEEENVLQQVKHSQQLKLTLIISDLNFLSVSETFTIR